MGLIMKNGIAYAGSPDEIDAKTVNGHTVESDVPVDAVFTDTVNSDITAEGNTIILTDLQSGVPFSEIIVKGENIVGQETVLTATGKNQLPITVTSGTGAGVTYTVDNDEITVSGTTTGVATITISTPNMTITEDMRLSYRGNLSGITPKATILRNGETLYPTPNSTVGSKLLAGDVLQNVYIQQQSTGVTVSGSAKFQLEYGTEVTEYEKYSSETYTFTPDDTDYVIPADVIQKEGINVLSVNTEGATLSVTGVRKNMAVAKLWNKSGGESYDDTEIREDITALETSLANKADKDNLVIYTKEYLPELIGQGSRGQEYYYNKTIASGSKLIGFDYIDSYFYIGIYGLGMVKVHEDEFYKLERVDSNDLERVLIFSDVFTYGVVSRVITRKNEANQIEFFIMYNGSTSPVEVYNAETDRCMSVELGGFGGNVTNMFKSANNRMFFYNQNNGVLGKLEEIIGYYPVHTNIQCSTNGIIDWSTDYTNNTGLTIFAFDDDIIYDITDYAELESWKERYQADSGMEGILLGGTSTITHIECWEDGVFFVTRDGQLAANYYNKQEANWELPWNEQPLGGALGYLDEPNPDYMFINTNNFLNCLTENGIKVIEGNPEAFNQVDLCLYENQVYPQYFDKSKCVYANHKLSCMFDNSIYVFEYDSEDRDMSDVVLALEDRVMELEAEIVNIKRHVGIE